MTAPQESQTPGYETRDANLRWVAVFGGFIVLLGILSLLLAQGAFGLLEQRAQERQRAPHPLAERGATAPGPQLQANPPRELEQYRSGQREAAESYGWIDAERGLVRLPQERALELILEEGLPSRAPEGQR